MKAGINWSLLEVDARFASCEILDCHHVERMKRNICCCFEINHTSDKESGSLAEAAREGTAVAGIFVRAGVMQSEFKPQTRSCECELK